MTAFPSQPPDAAPTLASAAQPSSAFTASVLAPSSVRAMMSREQAQCDLDELARVIRTRSSYALSVSFPIATAIAAVRSSLPSQVAVADLAVAVQKLIQEIGDAHAKVSDFERYLPQGYSPFALGQEGRRYFAYWPGDNTLLDEAFPYVQAMDGVALTRWFQCAGDLGAGYFGSPSSRLLRALGLLRHLQFMRAEMGLPAGANIELELVSADGLHTQTRSIPVAAQLEHTGKPFALPRESRLLEGRIGYLRIHSQSDTALTAEIPGWMNRFADTQGLIIDARQCGGGTRDNLMALFPYLMAAEDSPYVANVCKLRIPEGETSGFEPIGQLDVWDKKVPYSQDASVAPVLREALARFLSTFVPQWSVPQEPFTDWYFMALQPSPSTFHYTQPVVLLVDWGVGSAGDVFSSSFKGWRNVTLAGLPTNGRSGNALPFVLPHSGLTVMISTMASFQKDGRLYEGMGVEPDVFMQPTLRDWLGHSDSLLERGLDLLRQRQQEVVATTVEHGTAGTHVHPV